MNGPSVVFDVWSDYLCPWCSVAATRLAAKAAAELGVGGVPAVRLAESDVAITGAQPTETYRSWIRKNL